MAYENQIHCTGCGTAIPDVPEGSPSEALLCNACYDSLELQANEAAARDSTESGRLLPEDL
jgi:hypothetical protein